MRFSVGYELTDPVRQAILEPPQDAWVKALAQDGSERDNGEVAELTIVSIVMFHHPFGLLAH